MPSMNVLTANAFVIDPVVTTIPTDRRVKMHITSKDVKAIHLTEPKLVQSNS